MHKSLLLILTLLLPIGSCAKRSYGVAECKEFQALMLEVYPQAEITLRDFSEQAEPVERLCEVTAISKADALAAGLLIPRPGFAVRMDSYPAGRILSKRNDRLVLQMHSGGSMILAIQNNARLQIMARSLREAERLEKKIRAIFR